MEATFPDWACIQGYLLFKSLSAKGKCQYVYVPLDTSLIESIRLRSSGARFSLYRDGNGRITPVAKFVALCCLEQGVSIPAISWQLGVSESVVRWLRRKRWRVGNAPDRVALRELLRNIAFEAGEG
ncbi:hypothetical protein AWB79_04664 [Caballeronia hypogeia]|uniref:Uncharacterized protein n=1 Tax=Caballeronia hypogeia TaxID=1777140 RepID=A0A158C3F9_9BURK|nr:hypothetical protein AWB79_04664 [Caballeronia hypogeia]